MENNEKITELAFGPHFHGTALLVQGPIKLRKALWGANVKISARWRMARRNCGYKFAQYQRKN